MSFDLIVCCVEDAWTTISCDWSIADEPTAIASLVRAAHAAGCSVYDPQSGAHWPVAFKLPFVASVPEVLRLGLRDLPATGTATQGSRDQRAERER